MNRTNPYKGRASFWLVLVSAMVLVACAKTPPEERLRAAVAGLQSAIEKHDGSAVQDLLADDFIGPEGLDRDGARRLAQVMFLRYRDVGVTLGPLEVEVRQQHASVRFTAALTGGSGTLPESGQVYDVETGWRMEGGDWRLVNASWKSRL
ncbi:nuclear transport factor 2 family protein [Lysobacter tyrosinilyticus]